MGITKKQKQVYDYIKSYFSENGYSPTQDEIKLHFGFKSLGSVQKYIQYLTNAGYLKNSWNARRGLEPIIHNNENFSSVPLLGKVAAGLPIEAVENRENISVPANLIKQGEHFALQVEGDSMIEDGILEGDVIVIKKQATAQNGDTVVALIDNEATVKRFYRKSKNIELHPANSRMKPFIYDSGDLSIEGIVVGLIRAY
jgi:repressor LexA